MAHVARPQGGQTAQQAPPDQSSPPGTVLQRPGPTDSELEPDQRRVLLIAAHPDDPEFSSAGTVASWVRQGFEVVFVLATSGDRGTADRTFTPERLAATREQEERAAA